MGLDWTDKVDGQDYIVAEDVNSLAAAILENEGAITGLTPKANHGEAAYNKLQSGIGTDDIVDGAVTTGKIAKNAITGIKLSLAVYTAMQQGQDAYELLQNGIGTDNIANAAVAKAKLAADALAAIYGAYPAENVTETTRIRTLLGADAIPVKAATVKQTSGTVPTTWVIRRCGKNLFDASACLFRRNASLSTTDGLVFADASTTSNALAACLTYIPVKPGTRIVSQSIALPTGANVYYRLAWYDESKQFISVSYSKNQRDDYAVTAPANACFMRFCCSNALLGSDGKIPAAREVQFEIVQDPAPTVEPSSTPTTYEPYNGEDTTVTVETLNTPTAPTVMPTTVLGQNVISLFTQGALTDANPTTAIDPITVAATMDMTYRLDPTLAYNALRG